MSEQDLRNKRGGETMASSLAPGSTAISARLLGGGGGRRISDEDREPDWRNAMWIGGNFGPREEESSKMTGLFRLEVWPKVARYVLDICQIRHSRELNVSRK